MCNASASAFPPAARMPSTTCSQLSLFYMHGLGHGIGLDVHDPDQYESGPIGVGSAFTIEPGIYVRENLPQILRRTPNNVSPSLNTLAEEGVMPGAAAPRPLPAPASGCARKRA